MEPRLDTQEPGQSTEDEAHDEEVTREERWLWANCQTLQGTTGANMQSFLHKKKRQLEWRGVTRSSANKFQDTRWSAVVYLGKTEEKGSIKHTIRATYKSAEDAATDYDRAVIAIYGRSRAVTNYDVDDYPPEDMMRTGEDLQAFLKALQGRHYKQAGAEPAQQSSQSRQSKQPDPGGPHPGRCGTCTNCITQSGAVCLQNKSVTRGAAELNTEEPVRGVGGPDTLIGAAARQRMAALYNLQESSRILADSNTGTEGQVEGQPPAFHQLFYPSGVAAESARPMETCYDYIADLVKLNRRQEAGGNAMLASQEAPCQCCRTFGHNSDSCLLQRMSPKHPLMQRSVKAKLAGIGAQEGPDDAWTKWLPPSLVHTAKEIQKVSTSEFGTEGSDGGPKKRRKGLKTKGATAFSIIMDQLLQSNHL